MPKAAADLAVYRRTMGLPPCTTATGCFRKVNQRGTTTPLPAPDPGWALEGSMDIQLASATCPTCKILLVVADDNYDLSLAAATRTAIRLGATVLSHSYGTYEYGGMWGYRDTYERWPGRPPSPPAVTSADRAQAPAVFSKVLAVGGTSRRATGTPRGWDENVWSGAGGRDHDYDWAIVEPSSMRSIIQLAGRIRRHRPGSLCRHQRAAA